MGSKSEVNRALEQFKKRMKILKDSKIKEFLKLTDVVYQHKQTKEFYRKAPHRGNAEHLYGCSWLSCRIRNSELDRDPYEIYKLEE